MEFSMIISSLIICWGLIYAGTKLLNRNIEYKSKKFWLFYLLFVIYMIVIYTATNNFIRVILNFIVLSFILSNLYTITFIQGILLSFVVASSTFVAEIMFVLVVTLIFKLNVQDIQNLYFGQAFSNFFITLIIFALVHVKRINKICYNLISNFNKASYKVIIIFTFMSLLTLSLLLYYVYFEINLVGSLFLSIILIIIFLSITLGFFKERISNYNLKYEYDILINNLSQYEKMYALQRMKNHEYKNNLSVLRGMIDKSNDKALKYIDDLMEFKTDNNNNWMESLKRIPEGGLQGILYYKLLQADELKINTNFNVSDTYNPTSYLKVSEEVKTKICKLLGIYLDNAIQAVNSLEEKNIYLNIDENEDFIIFKIANNFSGHVDIDKIYDNGYSTKEFGHGYGLPIAKEIFDSEESIINKTQIIKDKFIQEIKIKK